MDIKKLPYILTMFIAACIAAVIITAVTISTSASTERFKTCVEAGGSYLHVPERTTMECVR